MELVSLERWHACDVTCSCAFLPNGTCMPIELVLAADVAVSTPQGGVLAGEQASFDTALAAKARLADQTYRGWCADTHVQVVLVTPWKYADRPDMVAWLEKVRVTGCGHSSIENINVGRMGGAIPWLMTFGLPGESSADMPLQRSTVRAALVEARADFRGCQDETLDDVYVTARAGGIDISPPGSPLLSHKGRPAASLDRQTGSGCRLGGGLAKRRVRA